MKTLQDFFGLKGKLAIVTGGAQGIGAGITEVLAAAGAKVVVADINAQQAEAQVKTLQAAGYTAASAMIDIADEQSVIEGVKNVVDEHGTPWILVNNAGLQDRRAFFDIDSEFFEHYQRVNTLGPFLMMREVSKAMIDAGRGGRIVNVVTLGVKHPMLFGLTHYNASKSGVMGLIKSGALELLEHEITVNAVHPAAVMTPGATGATGMAPKGPGMRGFPLGFCEPEDIGTAVLYLASPAAKRMTGQEITLDSGFLVT